MLHSACETVHEVRLVIYTYDLHNISYSLTGNNRHAFQCCQIVDQKKLFEDSLSWQEFSLQVAEVICMCVHIMLHYITYLYSFNTKTYAR